MRLCLQLAASADSTLDPLDALSDTLKDIQPAPHPVPAEPKDVVKVDSAEGGGKAQPPVSSGCSDWFRSLQEKKAVEKKLIKTGERDDSLPPEYRPTEEERKVGVTLFTPSSSV